MNMRVRDPARCVCAGMWRRKPIALRHRIRVVAVLVVGLSIAWSAQRRVIEKRARAGAEVLAAASVAIACRR